MAKSLKMFVRESAIKKEVATWSLKDCEEYLQKHKNDNLKKNSLLNKKISIVSKFSSAVNAAKNISGKSRQNALRDIPFEFLVKNAPKEAQDPKNSKKLKSYQKNTGVYLWSLGYDLRKFIGAGCSAVIWERKDGKVMRVACNNKYLGFIETNDAVSEVKDSKTIEDIIRDKERNSKHLFVAKHIETDHDKSGKAVFETELASHGDLQKFKNENYKYDIQSILQMASDSLKGLKVLHDKGYSHNDIKPDNILVTDKTKKDKSSRINLKIADFGAMTRIDNTYKIFTNKKFRAPDFWKLNKEAVEKRDVYSLGCIFIGLLMKDENFSQNYQRFSKELINIGAENFSSKYLEHFTPDEKIIPFLNLIMLMVKPDYKSRVDVDQALTKLKGIKGLASQSKQR